SLTAEAPAPMSIAASSRHIIPPPAIIGLWIFFDKNRTFASTIGRSGTPLSFHFPVFGFLGHTFFQSISGLLVETELAIEIALQLLDNKTSSINSVEVSTARFGITGIPS